jgi:hypothetical protein
MNRTFSFRNKERPKVMKAIAAALPVDWRFLAVLRLDNRKPRCVVSRNLHTLGRESTRSQTTEELLARASTRPAAGRIVDPDENQA